MIKIIKPKIDTKEYKFITLDNDLDILLIYDKSCEMSAAAMSINIGYYNDPENIQGLAHFLEHMLFMGTEKHKQENYYHEYMNNFGGISNAHTMSECTSYYFEILNNNFFEALTIFSYFFINPLLSKNAINREMKAVDSEYNKNITLNNVRKESILKEICNSTHKYNHFGCGNLKTLKKPNIREELLNFYNKYYSSNLMKLVILSNENITDMEIKFIPLFEKILNKNVKKNNIDTLPFKNFNNTKICSKLIKSIPVQDIHTIDFYWQIPNMDKYYYFKPMKYIIHLFGHESQGSIYYNLREKELCTFLNVNIIDSDSSFYLLQIYIELTEKGIKYIPTIYKLIFEYLDLIKNDGIHSWIYNELKYQCNINFDYLLDGNKLDFVTDLSMDMFKYDNIDILYGPYKMNEYCTKTKELIIECLNYINKDNLIINIASKNYENMINKITKTTKWYNVKYSEYNNPSNFGKEFKSQKIVSQIKLPDKNIFIPINVNVNINVNPNKYPIFKKSNNCEIWSYKNNKIKIPKVIFSIIFYIYEFYENIFNYIITIIYLKSMQNELNPIMYYAELFSSGYSYNLNIDSIVFFFYGYNDNICKIVELCMDKLFNNVITQKLFDFVKNNIKNDLINSIYDPIYIQFSDYLKEELYSNYYSNLEILNIIDNVSISDIYNFKKWLNGKYNIKSFIYGNFDKNLEHNLNKYLKKKCKYKNDIEYNTAIIPLQNGEQHLYLRKLLNNIDNNFLICIFFEIGIIKRNHTIDWEYNILYLLLISTHVKEKFFTQLRTIEQFGYIVRSFPHIFNNGYKNGQLYGLSFLVQSPNTNPEKLKNRIKKFINSMYLELKEINNNILQQYIQINKANLEKQFETPFDEFNYLNSEIITGDNFFDYNMILASKIISITKDDLIKFFETYFINKNTRKIRILQVYKKN